MSACSSPTLPSPPPSLSLLILATENHGWSFCRRCMASAWARCSPTRSVDVWPREVGTSETRGNVAWLPSHTAIIILLHHHLPDSSPPHPNRQVPRPRLPSDANAWEPTWAWESAANLSGPGNLPGPGNHDFSQPAKAFSLQPSMLSEPSTNFPLLPPVNLGCVCVFGLRAARGWCLVCVYIYNINVARPGTAQGRALSQLRTLGLKLQTFSEAAQRVTAWVMLMGASIPHLSFFYTHARGKLAESRGPAWDQTPGPGSDRSPFKHSSSP